MRYIVWRNDNNLMKIEYKLTAGIVKKTFIMSNNLINGITKAIVAKRPDSVKLELLRGPENDAAKTKTENQLNVGFKNLLYEVEEGFFHKRRKKILRNINGDFYAGDLTAIMGPSGCGKTTLMNILAGYTVENVRGELLLNGDVRNEDEFKQQMCYIMQDDHLQPLLTVNESMMIAANLKLTNKISVGEKKEKINGILEAIGLGTCTNIRAGKLSGGQKKRLSVALELLKNPQVMFFDEPTSGLDSSTSKQCLMLLKQLTQEGKTVICTIHQPSSLLFEIFDHLYAIAEGRCIYQGSIKGMLPYLEETGLRCPPYHNPADYLLEIANGEHGDYNNELYIKSENGKCPDWRKKHNRDTLQLQSINHIDAMMNSGLITPVKAPTIVFPDMVNLAKTKNAFWHSTIYPISFLNQLLVLIKRSFLILTRDRTLTYSRIFTHFSVAIVIGILYYGIGIDAKDLHNNANFLFFSVMFLMMTSFNCITLTCMYKMRFDIIILFLFSVPSEVALINKEHFNGWYSVGSYYISTIITDFPIQLIATLSYTLITFYMTCQPAEVFRLMYFLVICILISLVAQSFGMLIGSSWEMKTAVIIGPICFLPFTIFSGFFVQLHDAHPYSRWIFHISYLKYGFEATEKTAEVNYEVATKETGVNTHSSEAGIDFVPLEEQRPGSHFPPNGVIDVDASAGGFLGNPFYDNPFPSLFESFNALMVRMRQQLNQLFGRLPERSPDSPFPELRVPNIGNVDLGKGNTSSVTKIIDGHKVTINETEYKQDNENGGSYFKVRVIDVHPDSAETTEESVKPPIKDPESMEDVDISNDISKKDNEALKSSSLETFDEVDTTNTHRIRPVERYDNWHYTRPVESIEDNSVTGDFVPPPPDLSNDIRVNQLLFDSGAPINPEAEVFDVTNTQLHPQTDAVNYFPRQFDTNGPISDFGKIGMPPPYDNNGRFISPLQFISPQNFYARQNLNFGPIPPHFPSDEVHFLSQYAPPSSDISTTSVKRETIPTKYDDIAEKKTTETSKKEETLNKMSVKIDLGPESASTAS
ncbi:hypothetical protein FQA39_LY05391 [Lamprigera yunnana]|nr:hypothetical protein FQA39_LY05391 [Lamprigera yunnana]